MLTRVPNFNGILFCRWLQVHGNEMMPYGAVYRPIEGHCHVVVFQESPIGSKHIKACMNYRSSFEKINAMSSFGLCFYASYLSNTIRNTIYIKPLGATRYHATKEPDLTICQYNLRQYNLR